MNIVWTSVVVVCLVAMAFSNPSGALTVCVQSMSQGISVAVELCAVYCLWMGVFAVAEKCLLVEKLANVCGGVLKWLFGSISPKAKGYIALNVASNLLGVGNASTPSAQSAIREMEHGSKLSRAGAMLFVINATSIQLVPTTVVGLRASCGSANPADIVLPTLLCTLATTVLGVAFVFLGYGVAK
ncbi:MAG: hypothetical protein IJF10_03870 [Clostridia bacterium]|nr:hypothetical protein [Clostridia bacterium]